MRPKKESKYKRTIQVKVYLTHEEKVKLNRQFSIEKFITLSDFVRNRILKKRLEKRIVISPEFYRVIRSLDYELAKIGNNLNQIAHKLNAYNTYMLSEEDKNMLKECFKLQKSCVELLGKYMRLIRHGDGH